MAEVWINKSLEKKRTLNETPSENLLNKPLKEHKKLKQNNIKRAPNTSIQEEAQVVKTTLGKRTKATSQNTADGNCAQSSEGNKRRKLCNKTDKEQEHKQRDVTRQIMLRNRRTTNKVGPQGMLIRREWHYYLRHTHKSRHRVKKKHKLDSTKFPHPKRNRK